MILKEEYINIAIDGTAVTMHSHDPRTPEGHFRLDEVAIDGWYDGAHMRRTNEPRPTQWGDFPNRGYLASRLISITGVAVAPDRFSLSRLHDYLTAVLINGDYAWMLVETASEGAKYIKVGLEGKTQWIPRTDTFASFKIDFIAPDPRKYGIAKPLSIPAISYQGGMDYPIEYPLYYGVTDPVEVQIAFNNGNSDAWPMVEVEGNMPGGFEITDNDGHIVAFAGPVSPGASVILNFEEGWAQQSGSDRSSLLTSRDWFPIKPGGSIRPQLNYDSNGYGWMNVVIRDTWI